MTFSSGSEIPRMVSSRFFSVDYESGRRNCLARSGFWKYEKVRTNGTKKNCVQRWKFL